MGEKRLRTPDVKRLCLTRGQAKVLCAAQFRFSLEWPISSLHTDNLPYFDNLNFDIFDAVGAQCHFITPVLRAGRFPYVH